MDMVTGKRVGTEFGALEAFLPAVLVLGGDLTRSERLMRSVNSMWATFTVEPETIDYSSMTVVSPEYHLRPESVESAHYLYDFTGDERYRKMGAPAETLDLRQVVFNTEAHPLRRVR